MLATAVVEQHGDHLLGVYAEGTSVVIVAGDQVGVELARRAATGHPDIAVEQAAITMDRTADVGVEVRTLSSTLDQNIFLTGPAPDIGGVFVAVKDEPSAADRDLLEEFAAAQRVPLRVEVVGYSLTFEWTDSRATDPSPYAGGARVYRANGTALGARCTTGFGFTRSNGAQTMLTAGHCWPRGGTQEDMWIATGPDAAPSRDEYAGHVVNSTWDQDVGTVRAGDDNARHGDLALVKVSGAGNEAGRTIWWARSGNEIKLPVTSRRAPTLDDPVCFSGASSGADCGLEIWLTNVVSEGEDGRVIRNGDIAKSEATADCPIEGDSGAPVIFNHVGAETYAEAVGVVSGSVINGGDCVMVFTGVEEALQAWEGSLN